MVLTVNQAIVEPTPETTPEEMKRINNWVVWRAMKSDKVTEDGEQVLDKVLKRVNGASASSTDPNTWTDFHTAYSSYASNNFSGIGFVLQKENRIVGLDLDGHFEDNQPLTSVAKWVCDNTFVEISPSGTGAHAYFIGDMPDEFKHKYKDHEGELEIYNDGRFFTFTGVSVGIDNITDDQCKLNQIVKKYFFKDEEPIKFEQASQPAVLPTEEIKRRMLKNEKVNDLFNGRADTSGYQSGQSSEDMALCNHLAFWTGKNRKQMDELFRQSKLYRPKWDESRGETTYGFYTIDRAISECRDVYKQAVDNPHDSEDNVWDSIVTFDADEVLPFPKDVFPEWIERYIDQVSLSTQTPREMSAMAAFTALSIATSKKFNIRIYDSWIEPLNTYLLTLMPPASRKSQVFKDMTQPIADYQKELREKMKERIVKNEHEIDIRERRIARLKRDLSEPKKEQKLSDLENELNFEIEALENMEHIKEPTFIADDVTPEVLESLLKDNGERMAIVSPEGGLFSSMQGRYSDKTSIDVYLKGHPAERLSSHRLSRSAVELEEPHLTVGIFAQPTVIQEVPKQFFDKGLMARFLFSMPLDNRGERQIRPKAKDPFITERYYNNLKKLMELDADGQNIVLSRDADIHVQLLQEEIEMRQGFKEDLRDNDNIESWAGKLVGQLMRLAGLIHMATVLDDEDYTVKVETIQVIEQLKDYFISHAKKAFNVSSVDEDVEDAKYLLGRIMDLQQNGQLKRQELWQMVKQRFGKSEQIEPILKLLTDRGYIKISEIQNKSGKGRKSKMIILHPEISY